MRNKRLTRDTVLQVLCEKLDDTSLTTFFPSHSPTDLRQLIIGERDSIDIPTDTTSSSGTAAPMERRAPVTGCKLFTDGASRGNPGEAGAGAILYDQNDQELLSCSRYLGVCTNNAAEYQALLIGLEQSLLCGCSELAIFLDSELIVRQLEGRYKVKNQTLKPLYQKVQAALAKLKRWSVSHVPRAQNSRADGLANKGIDEKHL